MSWDSERRAEIEAAKARAQKRADETGSVIYVGLRYDMKVYVSKVKPTPSWLLATLSPISASVSA